VIAHVIGTVSLLMIFFSIGGYYQDYYSLLSQNANEAQLKQVAAYVASNLIDIVTLSQTVPGDQFLIKTIEIPYSINNNLYNISIIVMPSSSGSNNVFRIFTTMSNINEYSVVDLPWSPSTNIQVYTNQTITRNDIIVYNSLSSNKAASETIIMKEPMSFAIWCMKHNNVITLGLGVIKKN
jgi:hypothetical protein